MIGNVPANSETFMVTRSISQESASSALNILRCRIACMYTKKLSEFLRESEDDSDKEPAKSHRMQASIAKKVIDNRLNMTP